MGQDALVLRYLYSLGQIGRQSARFFSLQLARFLGFGWKVSSRQTVPWLSGRASRSHRGGRWFDPSWDHFLYFGGGNEAEPGYVEYCIVLALR